MSEQLRLKLFDEAKKADLLSVPVFYVVDETRNLAKHLVDNDNYENPEQIVKCPNCDELSYNNEKNICYKCDFGNDIEYNYEDTNILNKFTLKQKDLEKGEILFSKGDFEIYKISGELEKIKEVSFNFKGRKNKFIVSIDYKVEHKKIQDKFYHETEIENRSVENLITKIEVKINYIRKKVRVGYSEKKYSANYYGYMDLNTNDLIKFLEAFLNSFLESK
ncbi:MAG: hypothetical protein PHG82_00835 [Candidatus Gracilibacteria bacterium]|nr:hypothetical protein [Candidatus Gracilibacteria bacterium]